jgi:hypothetical protein
VDDARFDTLSRSLALPGATRRALFSALGGLVATGAMGSAVDAKKKHKKRCKRKRRCGHDCCQRNRCFAKKVNKDTERVLSFGCCSGSQLCLSPNERPDQCCYKDERCDPDNPEVPTGELCCRFCGEPGNETCCDADEECRNGDCVSTLPTVRLARTRR